VLRNPRLWIAIVIAIVLGVAVKIFLPFSAAAVRASVAIAPEILFNLGGFDVTPTIITSVIAFIILIGFAILSTRKMELVPSGLQNVIEMMMERLVSLFESIAGPMWPKFFTIAASIFFLVLVSNFVGLVPGAGSIGVIKVGEETHSHLEGNQVYAQDDDGEYQPTGIFVIGDAPEWIETTTLFTKKQIEDGKAEEVEEHLALVPFVRAPTSDINLPLALALVSVIATQIYGMQKQGLKYWTRFFSFGRLLKGDIAFGLIDVFVGLVEFISEIGKIVSFTFRLFGNIFAGEIILLIMAFLFLFLPFPFYAFEFFVAFIQAFVFAVLTMAFMRIATAEHGGEAHGEAHH
jgi:F-type H+-transporting ATPase subunit a